MEQLPGDVERLQQQVIDQKISTDDFFAMLLSTYELETSKGFLKSVIRNLKSLATTTAWGGRYKEIHVDLVEKYEDFFCETIVDNEDIFWSDDDEKLVEGDIGKLDLGTSDEFDDDKSGNPAEAALAFKLSLAEVDVQQKLSSKAGEMSTSTASAESSKNRRKKKKRKDEDSVVLLWFRKDLRLYDNPALVTACSLGKPVIPVFLWNEEEEGRLAAGGATKVWLEEALKVFENTLAERYQSRLILRSTKSLEDEMVMLARETGAKDVVWTALYEPDLKERDEKIERALQRIGVKVHVEHSYLLHRPEQIRVTGVGPMGIGSVTHFMECCRQNPGDKIGDPVGPPLGIPRPSTWPASHPLADLKLYVMPRRRDGTLVDWAKTIRESWDFGEEGGYANLRRFLDDSLDQYENESSRADQKWTAVISPYLHWGQLSPRLVLHEAFVGKIAVKFRRKLAWRDLSYWLLSLFPTMDREAVRPPFKHQRWNEDRSLLKKWQKGLTGYPLVDAAMRQLWATGWLNNYMRHVVASFLMSYLRFSWLDGYSWFQDTLLDADVAINAMMWQNGGFSGLDQWNFVMHPVNAAMTCDPRGDFVRQWVPELSGLSEKFIHQPWKCSTQALKKHGVELGVNYPHRCIEDLEVEREKSLQDVVEVRRIYGARLIDQKYGRDLLPIPVKLLEPENESAGNRMFMVPLITRKEFIFKTSRPESEDNPYNPVLKGYVSRNRDEEIARTNKIDFTASTMLEFAERKARSDRLAGVEEEEEERNHKGRRRLRGRGRSRIVQ